MSTTGCSNARWYRSFYFRIGASFVVFVVALVVAQSAILSYMVRGGGGLGPRPPNILAAIVAADVGAALAQDADLDLQEYVSREYGRVQTVALVMKDGTVASNRDEPLADGVRRSVDAVLAGKSFDRGGEPRIEGPPVVTAPVQVGGELKGMVVLPPRQPASPVVRDLGRMLSLPGTLLLVLGTTTAAAFIFAPARRRLRALEAATIRLGAGDLSARAREGGGDEIAHVAGAFNRMALDLAARDEALRTVDRLRRQMLADVSHELKTPLTAMRGCLETLRMKDLELDPFTRERYFQTIERETLRLDRIVQDLVDLARLENGVGAMEVRVFATERVFEHVVARHEAEAARRGIALRVSVGEGADQIVADPDRIEQVVENLVANALRFTPSGGGIDLSSRLDGELVIVAVVDSGEGIAAQHLAHVFDRFYKADSSRARDQNGSGLGLSISKAIVERHHGRIEVTSVPGRTSFTISLPQQPEITKTEPQNRRSGDQTLS
jgi:signal transduction histidine kinase